MVCDDCGGATTRVTSAGEDPEGIGVVYAVGPIQQWAVCLDSVGLSHLGLAQDTAAAARAVWGASLRFGRLSRKGAGGREVP